MRTRAEEPEQLQAQLMAAAASMSTGASNQQLAQAAAGQGSAAGMAELAKAAGGSQAAGALFADHPGVSADGIGTIGKHGSKPLSVKDRPPVHHMQSEHIVPFAIGARLWQLMSLAIPERRTPEDKEQTTIMIYKGAAKRKDKVDQQLIIRFKAEFTESGLARDMETARTFADGGGAGGDRSAVEAVLADVASALEEIRADAVERTVEAVAEENRAVEEGYELSNGERRAVPPDREPDLPTADDIESASQLQLDDIIGLAERSVRAADR